jgi:para-aminobenzoate synthetase / 4-amino-4-deoxychorismate lyase
LAHVDGDDVLLWNERDEITESSSANVVVKIDGQLFTPPIDSGLLAGTYRAELLAQGKIQERTISKSDLKQAQSIKLINSVRKWIDIELVSP